MKLFAKLPDGPVDVVGDIHGLIDLLEPLMAHLGYDSCGNHPEGRKLVFAGDLVDRGPDSGAVLRTVKTLVENGNAYAVLGNHEIAIMRGIEKKDNVWWTAPDKLADHEFAMAPIPEDEKGEMMAFLDSLPIVLEREDLRIVHACWHDESIEQLRGEEGRWPSVSALFDHFEAELEKTFVAEQLQQKSDAALETAGVDIYVKDQRPPFLAPHAEYVSRKTMENPLTVVTAGIELPAEEVFWVGGKWRMCDRTRWWEDYKGDTAVIFGHYWRMLPGASEALDSKFGPDLFAGVAPDALMGRNRNLYCVDLSAAGRVKLRKENGDESLCPLAAVRYPEWEVVYDWGERIKLQ